MPNFTSTDDTRLFFRDWGSGDPLVFVHGWGLNSDMWEYQLPDLVDRGFRCVAYDRRGCGRSDQPGDGYDFDTLADDLAALLDHLDLRDVTLVSHSMGSGEVARHLTRHGTGRVARVALISPTLPYLRRDDSNPEGVDPAAFEQIVAALRADRPGYLDDLATAALGIGLPGVEVSSALTVWALGLFLTSSPKASIDTVRTHTETDMRADMASFTVPTLIVHGDSDALVPIEISGPRAAAMIPDSTLVVYENASHRPFVTHRERLNEDLVAFARSGTPARARHALVHRARRGMGRRAMAIGARRTPRRARPRGARYVACVVGYEPGTDVLRAAPAALDQAYRGVRIKAGKGLAHAHVVATVLASAGCDSAVQVAGLLHDIVEDTDWTVADVRDRFGPEVAALVAALTEDGSIPNYRRRKRLLREQIAAAGPDALDIALADKVATLRYALTSGAKVPKRKIAHYEATVAMAGGAGHPAIRDEAVALLAQVADRDAAAAAA